MAHICYSLSNLRRLVERLFEGFYQNDGSVSTSKSRAFLETRTMLSKQKKVNAMKDTRRHDGDTGSPEAQVALLTRQIEELAKHLKKNAKDFHSRRGLLQMVANRRKHLKYLERKNPEAYQALIKQLGLKR